jgi:hypothetical protein
LTHFAEYATIVRMAPARIAVIALAFCACAVLAQQPAKGTLTVVVTDQMGAWISGARITATETQTGAHFEAIADGNGQAVLQIYQGSYELTVRSKGFTSWEKKEIKVNAETQRTATLNILHDGCPIFVETPDIPLAPERQALVAEIPLFPMQQFVPPSKPLRHKAHWF